MATQIEYLGSAESSFSALKKLRMILVLLAELTFAIGLPMIGLLTYMAYAEAKGIKLEVGCHGPGVPFSMLSGILYALILRIKCKRMDS